MSHYLVVGAAILVALVAAVTLYAAFKRRLLLMTAANTVMMLLLGLEQAARHETRWLIYLLFGAATIGLASTIGQYMRVRRT